MWTSRLSLSQRLPQQINERNEKLKEEMLGKWQLNIFLFLDVETLEHCFFHGCR